MAAEIARQLAEWTGRLATIQARKVEQIELMWELQHRDSTDTAGEVDQTDAT